MWGIFRESRRIKVQLHDTVTIRVIGFSTCQPPLGNFSSREEQIQDSAGQGPGTWFTAFQKNECALTLLIGN